MAEEAEPTSEHRSEISLVQIRMARAALGWGVRDLAAAAQVSGDTVNRLERGDGLRERTVSAIREAMEKGGVEFLPDNGVGSSVSARTSHVSN
jgi:ribosome-binding protein aMBF1 (putative translation factor)